jgi:hypothetical protein
MWVDPEDDPRETDAVSRGEKAVLAEYLDRYRKTLEMKCEGLDAEQLEDLGETGKRQRGAGRSGGATERGAADRRAGADARRSLARAASHLRPWRTPIQHW